MSTTQQSNTEFTNIGTIDIQNRIIKDIFLSFLGSDDAKLRLETARRFTNLIENLCFFETSELNIVASEADYLKRNLNLLVNSTLDIQPHSNFQFLYSTLRLNLYSSNYVQPFKTLLQYPDAAPNTTLECNLNFIIQLIMETLIGTTEKHRFLGCIEALDFIFQIYEPALYLNNSCLVDLLNLLVSYLHHSFVAFDLYIHEIILRVIGSLFCAAVWKFIIKLDPNLVNLDFLNTSQPWYLLLNTQFLINTADTLFTHLMHFLCLISSVVDESLLSNNSSFSSSSANPANLITSTLSGVVSTSKTSVNSSTTISIATNQRFLKPDNSDKQQQQNEAKINNNNSFMGSFQNSSIYLKLYDSVKLAYNSYKKSPHIGINDKFFKCVRSILKLLSQLMECAFSTNETSKYLDESLIYLKILFNIDSANVVKCVTQMLKSLFRMNFLNNYLNGLAECVNSTPTGGQSKIDTMNTFITMLHNKTASGGGGHHNRVKSSGLFSSLIKNISEDFNLYVQNQNVLFKSDQRLANPISNNNNNNTQDTASTVNFDENRQQNDQNSQAAAASSSKFSLNPLNLVNFIRKKPIDQLKQQQQQRLKLDSKLISLYIRSFESIVIKALRQYTTTCYVNLQVRVLELLIQLIYLKVNYSLLDSDKIFIDHVVLKQFDFLEQKHCSDETIITVLNDQSSEIDPIENDLSLNLFVDIDTSLNKLYFNCCSQYQQQQQSFSSSSSSSLTVCLTHKQNQHKIFFTLIPKVFEFLILLSYERIDSNQLITIPKIIQLCDNLLASENSPHTHVIPALRPLVYELFINIKLKIENNKELELQRDVLVIALQRLIYYPSIWHLLSIIISKYKKENNEDKWKKMSRQVCDILFQNIKFEQLKFNEFNNMDNSSKKQNSRFFNPYLLSLKNLLALFNSLCPQVYRPIDFILKSFIELINVQHIRVNSRNNWLTSCIAHLYLLINYSNEELILTRLNDLLLSTGAFSTHNNMFNNNLNVDNELINSASFIIKFLLKVINLTLSFINEEIQFNSNDYLKRSNINYSINIQHLESFRSVNCCLNLLYNYILYLIYILKSGYFKKITDTLSLYITQIFNLENVANTDEADGIIGYLLNINKIMFKKVSINFPLLALLWQYFLLICNNHESSHWNTLSDEKTTISSSSNYLSLNERIFKHVSLLVYCEYTTNNNLLDNTKNLTCLVVNNLIDLLELNNESCVLDVISLVHRNSSASSLFIQSISSNWNEIISGKKLHLLHACLRLLEGVHLSISGQLLEFLVEKYFKLPYLSLVRYADFIACQRLEMIQSLSIDEVNQQLNEEHLNKLLKYFQVFKYSHRHQRFISLLKKLNENTTSSGVDLKVDNNDGISSSSESCFNDKNLYYEGVKNVCCLDANSSRIPLKPKQCALILSELEYNNLLNILTSENFRLSILKECFILGANNTNKNSMLWQASKITLFELLSNTCASLPILANIQSKIVNDNIYYSKLNELLNSFDLYLFILPLIEATNSYLENLLSSQIENDSQSNDIITFLLFGLNLVSYVTAVKHKILTIHFIQQILTGIYNLLNNSSLKNTLIQRNNYPILLSSIIISLYEILISYFLKPGDENLIYSAKSNILYKTQSNEIIFNSYVFDILLKLRFIITSYVPNFLKSSDKGRASSETSTSNLFIHKSPNRFIHYDSKFFRNKIPFNIRDLIDKIYLGICSCPIIDRFLRISDALWFFNVKIDYSQLLNADSTLPSIEYLKDPHFLKEHIKHCLRVGWTTRSQFEYEYVNMLTLLHSLSTDVDGSDSTKMAVEEIKEKNRCACLVFKALSSWLIKATLSPQSGCSMSSKYEFLSRNRAPLFVESQIGQNFVEMKQKLEKFALFQNFSTKNSPHYLSNNDHHYLNKVIEDPALELDLSIIVDDTASNKSITNHKDHYLFTKNLERPMMNDLSPINDSFYYYSQVSLEGLIKFLVDQPARDSDLSYKWVKNRNRTDPVKRSFIENKLDLTSVLRTILDHYESFWKNQTLQVKSDILKSMIYIGNSLFDSNQQYDLLLTKLEEEFDLNEFFTLDTSNQANINPSADLIDDSTVAIALYGQSICKCCLQTTHEMKNKDFENINKLIENSLKTSSSGVKIASVHGLFYWLQSLSSDYLNSSIDSKLITEHLCKQINLMKDFTIYTTSNPRYISTLWSAIFFTIENSVDSIKDAQLFVSSFIKITIEILSDSTTPFFLFYQLYLGIERLLLSNTIPSSEMNSIQKLLSFKFQDEQRVLCLNLLQIASLYSSNQLKNINYWNEIKSSNVTANSNNSNNIQSRFNSEMYPQILELNNKPELQASLLKVLEVATGIFDKMKICSFNEESIACAHLLPFILCDFLPPHDLLNKLITEFSNSSQLSLPETMAYILYKCFDLLIQKGLVSQIQDWVLLSISNFILRPNTYESIWFMTCLLISSIKNKWLKAMFPFILNRNGIFEDIDRKIFFKAFSEFKNELKDELKMNSIIKTFEQVSKEKPIYQELLKFIKSSN